MGRGAWGVGRGAWGGRGRGGDVYAMFAWLTAWPGAVGPLNALPRPRLPTTSPPRPATPRPAAPRHAKGSPKSKLLGKEAQRVARFVSAVWEISNIYAGTMAKLCRNNFETTRCFVPFNIVSISVLIALLCRCHSLSVLSGLTKLGCLQFSGFNP